MLIIPLFVIIIITTIMVMSYMENEKYERVGGELINKIELYRNTHHKLPDNLEETNYVEVMDIGPYYEKIDEHSYRVYFCLGFDNYKMYDSRNRSWSDANE